MNSKNKHYSALLIFLLFALISNAQTYGQAKYPAPVEGDYAISDFHFASGEIFPFLNMHYNSIGTPILNKDGKISNAVLVMHGTSGSSKNFLTDGFAGELFGPGKILDAAKYFIIMPDALGHGKSSKPSDGFHMRFPKYTYDDMVLADFRLLTEHLNINHLRLVMGTSMGGMHTWVWGYTYPGFMDALMPLASLPVTIAGRNRILRKMAIDCIEMDPEWKAGEYKQEPQLGMRGAISSFIFMVSSPLQWQKNAPTRELAETMMDNLEKKYAATLDANDFIYQLDASRNYNPQPYLGKIIAPLFAINSADDQVNPPELGIMEKEIKNVKNGRYVLLPITDKTNGHGTHSIPSIWGEYLQELLKISRTIIIN
jgi:homoserine O-acetyltransferase